MRMEQGPAQTLGLRMRVGAVITFLNTVVKIEGVELLLVFFHLWWSLMLGWLAGHIESFAVESILAREGPLWIWSISYFLTAIMILYGFLRKRTRVRRSAMIASACLWGVLAAILIGVFVMRGTLTSWTGPSMFLAISAGWTYWRLSFVQQDIRLQFGRRDGDQDGLA